MKQIGLYPFKYQGIKLSECMHMIKETGFDYVAASNLEQLLDDSSEGLIACAKREHLPIDNIHLNSSETNSVWVAGTRGDEIIDRYCYEMDQAVRRGVTMGVAHVTWGYVPVMVSDLGIERYTRLVKHAEKVGFTICFENSVFAEHFYRVHEAFDSPNVGFTFDSGHWSAFTPETSIPFDYAHRMRITHLNDNDGARDLHMLPFDGTVPYARIAPAMRGMERLTFELKGIVRCECPGQTAEEVYEDLRHVHILNDDTLLKVRDGEFTMYEDLSCEAYLARAMAAAKRIRNMVEAE